MKISESKIYDEPNTDIENQEKFAQPIAKIKEEYETKGLDKMERFIKLFPFIYDNLPGDEKTKFLEDPINFTSKSLFFRGLQHNKAAELIHQEKMIPTSGDYSKAVFLTDAPAATINFFLNDGALAIFDRKKTVFTNPKLDLIQPGSDEYKKEYEKYLNSLPESKKGSAPWYFDDTVDQITSYTTYDELPWSTIHLRQPQPINAVKKIISIHPDSHLTISYDPSVHKDMEELKKIF